MQSTGWKSLQINIDNNGSLPAHVSDHEDLRGTVGIILPVGWKELKDEAEMKRGMLLSGSHSEVS